MTTDTEALRAQFEQYVNPDGDVNLHWLAAGFYAGTGVQKSWLDFQAGHAAAKAETVASKGRWYVLSGDGMATLCASEADALAEAADADAAWPRMAPHRAVQLVPADQLADAVAKEREHCALVCEDVRRAVAEINGSGVAAAQQCADAIRAGAKGVNRD